MARPDVEGVEVLVDRLYITLLAECGPEIVQSFGLLRFIHAKVQGQAPLRMVFFS